MPVLLEEFLLPFWLLLPALVRVLKVLLQPLLLGQGSAPLYLFALEFTREGGFFVAFDTCKFA